MMMAIRGKKWEQLQLRLNDGQFWAKNLEQVHCTDGAAEKMQLMSGIEKSTRQRCTPSKKFCHH